MGDLAMLCAQARDLEELLRKVASHLLDDQVDRIDAQLTSKQRDLIVALAAGKSQYMHLSSMVDNTNHVETTVSSASHQISDAVGGDGVIVTTVSRISKRDQQLLELAACSGASKSKRCAACDTQTFSGRMCDKDDHFYCDECWYGWEKETTASSKNGCSSGVASDDSDQDCNAW